jgi:hypothetical protein
MSQISGALRDVGVRVERTPWIVSLLVVWT